MPPSHLLIRRKMTNSIEGIGERIRLERLKHNMTQTELADGKITRSMLSLIESGASLPSLETLVHIANKLDIPVGKLFASDMSTEALYNKTQTVAKAKKLFSEGRYEKCADVSRSVLFDDELAFLAAECELKEAERKMKLFTLASASENLEKALALSSSSVYIADDFEGTVKTYLYFISCATAEIDEEEIGRLSKCRSRIPAADYAFMTLLSMIDKGKLEAAEVFESSYPFMSYNETAYFRAAMMLRNRKNSRAREILEKLLAKEDLSFILKYRILADLETCAEIDRDFEAAYAYSNEKHKMRELYRR